MRPASSFGLSDLDKRELVRYIGELNRTLIQLRDREDELVWDVEPHGYYNPKGGYLKLSADGLLKDPIWWWKKLWKINSPPKTRLFLSCVPENKVLTWDNLQKRCFQGSGWCMLCKEKGESVLHLFLHCSFVKDIWKECTEKLGVPCLWEGPTVLQAWEN